MATSTLKILREISDYTQEFVAEEVLGISQTTYARLEQNPSRMSAFQAQKLADLYKVSISNLLSEATPIITFKDSIKSNTNGNNGYNSNNISHFNEVELNTLKEEIDFLRKTNTELMTLVKVLGGKLLEK